VPPTKHQFKDGQRLQRLNLLLTHTKDLVQRRCVNNEHCKAGTAEDTRKIVVVADERPTERDSKLAFHGKHLQKLKVNFDTATQCRHRTHIETLIQEDAQINHGLSLRQGIHLHRTSDGLSTRIMKRRASPGEVI
jgi:hypothetical protein